MSAGLNYCAADEALYFEMLDDFCSSFERKLMEKDRLFLEENWHDYGIVVHALKSNAKMIGGTSVYEFAKALEEAAQNNDTRYIKEHHKRLLQMTRNLTDGILHSVKSSVN